MFFHIGLDVYLLGDQGIHHHIENSLEIVKHISLCGRLFRNLRKSEEVFNDSLAVLALSLNSLDNLMFFGVFGKPLQQYLGKTQDDGNGIIDFVGHTSRKGSQRREFFRMKELPLYPLVFRDIPCNHQNRVHLVLLCFDSLVFRVQPICLAPYPDLFLVSNRLTGAGNVFDDRADAFRSFVFHKIHDVLPNELAGMTPRQLRAVLVD